ncbi:MAG: hypothetical protein Q4G50_11590 [Corynebacterium sp.]|uniref:hypothetical protein n=1 Tax=Corynebacterium sp. TaxID=1720 RepID=UPI0026DEEE50|nr:hypothetical protein [Corynebacterium sp.]MDO5670626.1 hypothetical protein [Corynebacterium sp.]
MIFWTLLAVLLTAVVAWAYFTAQRLNRLHIRTDAALAALQAALDRQAAVVAALVPEARALAESAENTPLVRGDLAARSAAELALAESLRGVEKPSQLIDAEVRVRLAHRFYNDAVADTRALRLRPLVRAFHLGGTAPLPVFYEHRP